MTKGKETANSMQGDVEDQFNSHVQRRALYETQMERVQKEIFEANQDLDQNVLDISTDCTDKCRTGNMSKILYFPPINAQSASLLTRGPSFLRLSMIEFLFNVSA